MKLNVTFSSSTLQWNKVDFLNIAFITFVWIIMTIVVNPLGDFPLNDDWAYAESVKHLLETGKFQLPGWAVANLLPQVLWGALFCLPLGFSFTALRFSTLTLGLIGVIATYKLLQEIIVNRQIALIGAFILAVNPLYFGLANTFMTDVPHYAVTILSLYFFCRGINQNSQRAIIIAIFLAIISLLIRQVTAALFFGYAIAYVVKNKAQISSIITAGILFIGVPIGIQTIFARLFWPKNFGNYGAKEQEFVSQFSYINIEKIVDFLYFALSAFIYLGCFIFPFLMIAYIIKIKTIKSLTQKSILTGSLLFLSLTIGLRLFSVKERMPVVGNVLIDWGLGPLTLRDTLLSQSESIPNYLANFWIIITIVATIGAALLLIFTFFSTIQLFSDRHLKKKSLILLNNSTAFIYFLPLGLSFFFDRYLLLLLPLSMVMVLQCLNNIKRFQLNLKTKFFTVLTISSIGLFTVAATHDYLSWNRVRWQALENLMQQQITPDRIDGGFEFNGWYLYDPNYQIYQKIKNNDVWWWSEKNDYIIAFSPIEGYTAIEQYPLQNWLPFPSDRILVLHKK